MNSLPSPEYFDGIVSQRPAVRRWQRHFHSQLADYHCLHVQPEASVAEWGCGDGQLLRRLPAGRAVGFDFSPRMIEVAQRETAEGLPHRYVVADSPVSAGFAHGDVVDVWILSYLTGYLDDVQAAYDAVRVHAHPRTRLVVTSLNHLWRWPLGWAQWFGLVTPQPESAWLTSGDLVNLLELSGWEVVENGTQQLLPFEVPLLTPLANRLLARLPGVRWLGITLTLVARPRMAPWAPSGYERLSCSVIVPMRNEAGNVTAALRRVPVLGRHTELVFVEGNSSDDTWDVLEREIAAYRGPHSVRLARQPGKGKWDAVRTGFSIATGDVVVIQDGDLTAPPEDLPKFFDAIASGAAEFANGSRLVYPMEGRAMRFLNFLGNKFFALALSYVLGQPIKDSLCGTKMLLRSDYLRILKRIEVFGEFDPFGDFNLLFGAALLRLKIRDVPVRYKDRTYGETNISRFRHGWLLLKMTWFGLRKIRFG